MVRTVLSLGNRLPRILGSAPVNPQEASQTPGWNAACSSSIRSILIKKEPFAYVPSSCPYDRQLLCGVGRRRSVSVAAVVVAVADEPVAWRTQCSTTTTEGLTPFGESRESRVPNGCLAMSRADPKEDGGRRRSDPPRLEPVMRALETLILVLVVTLAFMWVILAHTTPEEQARLHDSMGESTHIAWR